MYLRCVVCIHISYHNIIDVYTHNVNEEYFNDFVFFVAVRFIPERDIASAIAIDAPVNKCNAIPKTWHFCSENIIMVPKHTHPYTHRYMSIFKFVVLALLNLLSHVDES